MADLAYPTLPVPTLGIIQGREQPRYTGTAPLRALEALPKDLRLVASTLGTISDVMVLKTSAGEVPFVTGRVWLLRAADGRKAWEGWTDAAGAYTATGLENGVEYIAVGIDPTRQHKSTAAGPVLSV